MTRADLLRRVAALVPMRAGVRVGVDGIDFHNPRAIRYRQGRDSPEGYWLDAPRLVG